MIYRALDANGDYVLGKNMGGFLFGAAATAQAIQTSLKLLMGEWWEAVNIGFPLFQKIFGQSGTPAKLGIIDQLIQNYILSVPTVASLSNFARTYVNRQYGFSCQATTTNGETFMVSNTLSGVSI